jgi:hypothetical protein
MDRADVRKVLAVVAEIMEDMVVAAAGKGEDR